MTKLNQTQLSSTLPTFTTGKAARKVYRAEVCGRGQSGTGQSCRGAGVAADNSPARLAAGQCVLPGMRLRHCTASMLAWVLSLSAFLFTVLACLSHVAPAGAPRQAKGPVWPLCDSLLPSFQAPPLVTGWAGGPPRSFPLQLCHAGRCAPPVTGCCAPQFDLRSSWSCALGIILLPPMSGGHR